MQFSEAYDFGRALSHGFEAFKKAWLPMFMGGAILSVLDGGCQGSGNSGGDASDFDELQKLFEQGASEASLLTPQLADGFSLPQMASSMDFPWELGIIAGAVILMIALVVFVAIIFFRSFVYAGFLKVHQEILDTGASSVGTLFSGADRTLHVVGYAILTSLIMAGVFAIAGAPAAILGVLAYQQESMEMGFGAGAAFFVIALPALVYVQLGLALGNHAIVLEDEGPIGALERSWGLTSGNRMWLALYGFIMFLVAMGSVLGGFMALCIGVLVFVPIARSIIDFGYTESFLTLTRSPEETRSWQI